MSTTPPNTPTPPPATGQAKPPMTTGAKVGIGCGVFAIIAVIIIVLLVGWCKRKVDDVVRDFSDNPERATAEMIVKMNPELDLVNTDDEAGTITFSDKSGKETTVTWADLADGKLTVSDSEGREITLGSGGNMDAVPAWVPRLPEVTRVAASHHATDGNKTTGSFMVGTPMSTADIESFLADRAAELEMESTVDTRQSIGGGEMQMTSYQSDGRSFSATIIREGSGDAQVQFIYEEKSGS